ncbi:MAG: formylglycine-generating enzyme family protein [Symploca sp. SIO2G7]|nr:formylglycine-generating enzyme family protein [Symploca sp. SIO2G7]
MQWRILDDYVEIDLSYITCAEYQLFIDQKRQAGKNRQPDHWKNYRFPRGDSQKPITGVRASDAEEFCQWLTWQHFELGFRYRLPTLAEAQKYPATEQLIGCWCNDRGKKVVVGIEATQWQDWYSKLAKLVILNRDFCLDFNRGLNQDLYLYLNQVLNRDLNQDLYLYLNLDLYLYLNRNLDLDLYQVLNRDFYQVLNRDLKQVLNRDFYQVLNRDFYQVLNRDFYQVINQDIDLYQILNQDINLYLYRDFYKRIEADEASEFLILYFPLLFFIVIYHVLSLTYQVLSQNKDVLKQIKLSSQKSEAISRKYKKKIDKIYPLYVYLVLLDERQAGWIPAWEGIRLVRERIES